jgi:hypothetical protein
MAKASCLVDIAIDLQDELARLGYMSISTSEVAGAFADPRVRSPGRQAWEQRQSML